ncbi:MAG: nitronate monooxygenase [Glaciecola sp.]
MYHSTIDLLNNPMIHTAIKTAKTQTIDAKDFFGISRPIIQSTIVGVCNSRLTIAVSNAGGMGSMPCALLTGKQIVDELRIITPATAQPFNLNFFCYTAPTPNAQRKSQWLQALQPFFTEYDLSINATGAGFARQPFSQDIIDIIEPFRPPVLSFHFGLPAADLIDRAKAWGALIVASATSVSESIWLEANGADTVITQGLEAGSHRGLFLSTDTTTQMSSLVLIS